MIPGLEMLACEDLAVPMEVMEHVVRVESSGNPYAIGVVGARLERQPESLEEAVATAEHLEEGGHNFSLGLAQVNRYNLAAQGLDSYEAAFAVCPNLAAGARILADCHGRANGDWGKAFSCYYSGNFTRGFRDGYVQKVGRSMRAAGLDILAGWRGDSRVDSASAWAGSMRVATLRERRSSPALPAAALPPPGPQHPADGDPLVATAPGASDGPFVPLVTAPAGAAPVRQPAALTSSPLGADSAFVF